MIFSETTLWSGRRFRAAVRPRGGTSELGEAQRGPDAEMWVQLMAVNNVFGR